MSVSCFDESPDERIAPTLIQQKLNDLDHGSPPSQTPDSLKSKTLITTLLLGRVPRVSDILRLSSK